MTNEALIAQAMAARDRAYAPYSHFPVGAALLGKNGKLYTGCNVECASYGGTICAERSAVCAAVSDGCRQFERLAVIAGDDAWCTPCGICRQVLWEFAPELTVLCCRRDGKYQAFQLRDLLPEAFALNRT